MARLGGRWGIVFVVVIVVVMHPAAAGIAVAGVPDTAPTAAAPDDDDDDDAGPPPDGPDHGINNTTWWKLWSGDTDTPDLNYSDISTVTSGEEAARQLANASDFVFNRPPKAVETWNAGEHGRWNGSDPTTSRYPPDADRSDGERGIIKDAYIEIVSLGPSTIVHRQNRTTRWIGPRGRALAIVDFRVAIPANETTIIDEGNGTVRKRVNWTLTAVVIGEERFRSNYIIFDETRGEYAPTFEYRNVPSRPHLAQNRTMTAEATVGVTLRKVTRRCRNYSVPSATCPGEWEGTVEAVTVEHSVEDTVDVKIQRFDEVDMLRFDYAQHETAGLLVEVEEPWRGIRVTDNETVRSSWWFYTRQRPDWGTMSVANASTVRTENSSVRPLETHAIPAQYEPTVIPYAARQSDGGGRTTGNLTLVTEARTNHSAPALPDAINVELAHHYSSVREVRLESTTYGPSEFMEASIYGIVRNVSERHTGIPITAVNELRAIDVEVVNETNTTLTVQVVVFGAYRLNKGTVVVDGHRKRIADAPHPWVEITIPRQRGQIPVRWEHGEWSAWETNYATNETKLIREDRSLLSIPALIDLLFVTLVVLFPLGLLLYGFDRLAEGKLLGREERYQ